MGIFNALTTAVSGLQAQSFALENISGNIANSQTAAYKRTDTSFQDLVSGGNLNISRQTSGSVMAYSQQTNSLYGTVQASSSGTSIAVNGAGYLMVADGTESNGQVNFGSDLYTRRGDFELDKNGYLVNGAGYYLKGVAIDPVTGNRVGSTPEPIRLANDMYPAAVTSSIDYRANLPTVPQTSNYDATDSSSWLLDSSITGTTVTADQSEAFMASTISGDAITVYDKSGGTHDVQFRWGKVSNGDSTATPATEDTWALFYQSDTTATGTDTAWTKVGDYSFDSTGALTSSSDMTISGMTLNGAAIGDVALTHGTGLTSYADTGGTAVTKAITQNGNASGTVQSIAIADGGKVEATYSNGKTRTLFEVPLVTFPSENRLAQVDGGAYAQTVASGAPTNGGVGEIEGSAIELSNVDIADEFSKIIVTQQAYSANTRVISTSNDMLQETLSMIR